MVFISKCGSSHLSFHFLPKVLNSRNSPHFDTEASVHKFMAPLRTSIWFPQWGIRRDIALSQESPTELSLSAHAAQQNTTEELKRRTFTFFTVLEAWHLRSRCHRGCCLSSWLLDPALSLPPRVAFSLYVLGWGGWTSTSSCDTSSIGQGPSLMTSFILKCLLKRPISKYSHTGVRASAYEFGEDTMQSKKKKNIVLWRVVCDIWDYDKIPDCVYLPAERKSLPFAFVRHGFESSAASLLRWSWASS